MNMNSLKERVDNTIAQFKAIKNPYELYEMCKRIIKDYILSTTEYERMIRYIADEIGI